MPHRFWILCIAALSFHAAGCSRKVPTPAAPAAPQSANLLPAAGADATPPAPPPPPPSPRTADATDPATPAQGDGIPEPTLAEFRRALELWTFQRNDPPADLNDLVKQGYLKKLPSPPPGKRFAFDRKKMQVYLADQ
jgi:hypothetical protein